MITLDWWTSGKQMLLSVEWHSESFSSNTSYISSFLYFLRRFMSNCAIFSLSR